MIPDRKTRRFHPLLFYALAIAIAWVAWTPLLLVKYEGLGVPVPYPVLLFLCQTTGAFAPLFALLLIQRLKHEPGLVREVFAGLRFRGVPVFWLLLPALVPMAIAVASAVAYGVLSPNAEVVIVRPEPLRELGWALLVVVPFAFVMGLIGSPLGEEPGWRGYLFDHFVREGRALRGSGVVAGMWWIWHLPLFLVLDVTPNGYSFLEMAGHSLLIDSLFILSGRNLLAAMLYHQGVNTSFMFLAAKTQTAYGLVVLLGIAGAVRVLAERRLRRTRLPAGGGEAEI